MSIDEAINIAQKRLEKSESENRQLSDLAEKRADEIHNKDAEDKGFQKTTARERKLANIDPDDDKAVAAAVAAEAQERALPSAVSAQEADKTL